MRQFLTSLGFSTNPIHNWTDEGSITHELWCNDAIMILLAVGSVAGNEFCIEKNHSFYADISIEFNKWSQTPIHLSDYRKHSPEVVEKALMHLINTPGSYFESDMERKFEWWPTDENESDTEYFDTMVDGVSLDDMVATTTKN